MNVVRREPAARERAVDSAHFLALGGGLAREKQRVLDGCSQFVRGNLLSDCRVTVGAAAKRIA